MTGCQDRSTSTRLALFAAAWIGAAATAIPAMAADEKPSEATSKPLLDFDKPQTIVCLGDSVTGVYYHTGGVRAYPEMLEIALKKAIPNAKATVINAGISGHTTQNGLDRLDRDVISKKPNLVTVSFGLNDMTRMTPEQFRTNLETITARCREAGAMVVLCTPNSVIENGGRPRAKLVTYCDVIRAAARDLKAPLCDQHAAGEALRAKDAKAWRLLFSDEIHPNMDGHRRMAEELCRTIGGRSVSLDDVDPPLPALPKVLAKLQKKQPVKVLAMPPYDTLIGPALKTVDESAQVAVTAWPTEGQTLAQLHAAAQQKVRAMKPDLVVIAVPRSATAAGDEQFITGHTWVMNWSLSFGLAEWDAFVVHPAVASPNEKDPRDDLVRTLVKAQHLYLIDRPAGDDSKPEAILTAWLKAKARP